MNTIRLVAEKGLNEIKFSMLSDFPKYGELPEEDVIEWNKWLERQILLMATVAAVRVR
jgi:hypothetical protein